LRVGFVFLLAAMVLIGIQASLEGVPGAWLAGHVLIYFLAVAWIYLGIVPRTEPVKHRTRQIFRLLLGVATLLGLVAVYEVLVLFPQATSVQEQVGISLYSLSFILSALGLITCVFILVWRSMRLPVDSYLRQQVLILLFFFALGILPTMFLTVIPRALVDQVLLPFPVAISLMVLVPAGYLFVIYRRGFLGLDIFFSRIIYLSALSLVVFGFYASGLYLVQHWLQLDGAEAVAPATVIFFPTLLLTIYANQPIHQFVQRLIYGRALLDQEHLADFTFALSTRPETDTLHNVVVSLAGLLNASQAALALRDDRGQLSPITVVGSESIPTLNPAYLRDMARPIVRSINHPVPDQTFTLFHSLTWAEIVIPVLVRDETIGFLAMSRPGEDGYFNAQQVLFLMQAAGVLAVASQNLYLFESTRRLSRDLLAVQDRERKQIAGQIHDEPLQRITYVISLVDRIVSAPQSLRMEQIQELLTKGVTHLRTASHTLREICMGLHSPLLDQGLDLAAQEIVYRFQDEHGLQIDAEIQGEAFVSKEKTLTVCHILTESLNNVVKHAQTVNVSVSLVWDTEHLSLQVADRGQGSMLSGMTITELIHRQHLGIVGMYEWAQLAGGELSLQTNQPTGMRVCLQCPLG
jgi:signal transduction histidine kinase